MIIPLEGDTTLFRQMEVLLSFLKQKNCHVFAVLMLLACSKDDPQR
jgi:hypothetical protein